MRIKLFGAAVAALAFATSAQASVNLVQNGGFEDTTFTRNTEFGPTFGGQGVTNWTGLGGNHLEFYYFGGTQTTVNAINQYNDPQGYFHPSMNTLSSNGGNFVGLDGDSDYAGQISQTITGLQAGKSYVVTFDWGAAQLANRTGPTTEQLAVSLGGETHTTNVLSNVSEGFTGWNTASLRFTATGSSQVLSFLSLGTPNGLPPIAVLDGISLSAVPEPAVWSLMLIGFGGLGASLRRRRALANPA